MLYNASHTFTRLIVPPSQDAIFNCPEFYAMSVEEIRATGKCPDEIMRVIDDFPWSDRANVLQVRPQDFRTKAHPVLGRGWHIDNNVRLNDGNVRTAKDMFDWRLLTAAFGNVVETEFVAVPMELPDLSEAGADHGAFFRAVAAQNPPRHSAAPNQVSEYTSRDIHTVGDNIKLGRLRLMIVAIESSDIEANGRMFPSIRETGGGMAKSLEQIT